ncbi:dual oxidase, partial [Trichonephila inaurata madagascariensis]
MDPVFQVILVHNRNSWSAPTWSRVSCSAVTIISTETKSPTYIPAYFLPLSPLVYVKEWLHNNHKRCVKVKIGPDDSISTLNRKGETLRKVDFQASSTLVVEVTEDVNRKPMVLLRSPRDHDLVLQFRSEGLRKKFLSRLESFLSSHKKTLELLPVYRDGMLANAETKEKRQKRLEHFFREAYAL